MLEPHNRLSPARLRSGILQPHKRCHRFQPIALGRKRNSLFHNGLKINHAALKFIQRITLASPDPFDAPLIDPNLLSAPEDLAPLIGGIRLARKIFASAAFEKYRAEETSPGGAAISDAELAAYVRAEAYTVHHPVSTCRMGNDAAAVVDPQLRVAGLENLRVADASVFPSIIGGNTNAAVVMIAEKASDLILGRPPLAPETFGVSEPPSNRVSS